MGWDGAGESANDPADDDYDGDNDVQDAVPPEWIRMVERERAAEEAAWRARHQHRLDVASWLVPALVLGAGALAMVAVWLASSTPPAPPAGTPAAVRDFAKTIPESRLPNAAGVAVVDGTDAPNTWRVAWETADAAFCFAFVHQSEPAQTLCDAPGSMDTAQMRIGGELSDTGLNPPELFTCGYTTGPAEDIRYVEINDGAVVGDVAVLSSGMSAFCLQLPEDTAAGASFTVSTTVAIVQGPDPEGKDFTATTVTATYR